MKPRTLSSSALTPTQRRILRELAVDLVRASDLNDPRYVWERLDSVRRELDALASRARVAVAA